MCYDIKGAFLNAAFISSDEIIYFKISSDIVEFWKLIDSNILNYLDDKGCVNILKTGQNHQWFEASASEISRAS